MFQALQRFDQRFDRLEIISKQASGRTVTLMKSAVRFTLSNNDTSCSRTEPQQTAFKEKLIKRYDLLGQQTGHIICMVTGAEVPRAGTRAAHIVSLSKFVQAQADISLLDPWDIRNGIIWLG